MYAASSDSWAGAESTITRIFGGALSPLLTALGYLRVTKCSRLEAGPCTISCSGSFLLQLQAPVYVLLPILTHRASGRVLKPETILDSLSMAARFVFFTGLASSKTSSCSASPSAVCYDDALCFTCGGQR